MKQKEMNEKRQSQRNKILFQMSMQIETPKYRNKINAKKAMKLMFEG